MFKNASGNAQSRSNRTAEFGRSNEAGIDPSAFAKPDKQPKSWDHERAKLVGYKQDIEEQLHVCKSRIATAERAHRTGRETALSSQLYFQLLKTREDLTEALFKAQRELRALNLQEADARRGEADARRARPPRPPRRDAFADVFLEMAKEILAKPVLDRLTIATIHRIGERKDDRQREADGT